MSKTKITTLKLVYSAVCLAFAFVLPFLTGQIPTIGKALLPMHLPVLLCGFLCGKWYGLVVGFAAPLLRSFILGMPPFFPTAVAMSFELAAYGFFAGLFFAILFNKRFGIIISLVLAMIAGRVVWGLASLVCYGFIDGKSFTFKAFIAGAFVDSAIGIAIQLVLIPALIYAFKKAKLILVDK